MTHNFDYLSKDFQAEVLRRITEMDEGMPLYECLVAMQVSHGLSYEEAERNADLCIAATAARETLVGHVSEDAMAVMDKFLQRMAGLEPNARMDVLHRILFGLTVYSNPPFAAMLDADTPVTEVYEQWLDTRSLSGVTFAGMEAEIRQALQDYSLSPAAMGKLTRQMLSGKGCLAAAEALGQRGRSLKCLMAMEFWLHNRDAVSMEEAVSIAGSSAEIQAAADAVNRGYVARDTAKKILIAVGITAIIVGAAIVVWHIPSLLEGLSGAVVHPTPTGTVVTAEHMAALNQLASDTAAKCAAARMTLGGLVALGGSVITFLSNACADAIARIAGRSAALPVNREKTSEIDLTSLTREDRPSVTIFARYPENLDIVEEELEDDDEDPLIF